MPSISRCTLAALLVAASLLSACATSVSVDDLYRPHYGLRAFPHFDASVDPDPMAIANGLYAPRPLQDACYRCSSRSPINWAGWSP
jgi:hypothetical protein